MLYNIKLTPAQVAKLAEWTEPEMADVLLLAHYDDSVTAGQGDSRVTIAPDGSTDEDVRPAQALVPVGVLERAAQLADWLAERQRGTGGSPGSEYVSGNDPESIEAFARELRARACCELASGVCSECGTDLPGDPENTVCPSCSEED